MTTMRPVSRLTGTQPLEWDTLTPEQVSVLSRLMSEDLPEWYQRAACQGLDTRMFFPGKGHNDLVVASKRVCASCPVRKDCLAEAQSLRDPYGIYGGLTAREREKLRGAA